MLPLVRVPPDSDMKRLVAVMRQAAEGNVDTKPGQGYSRTPAEAAARAAPFAEQILSEGTTRVVQFLPNDVFVSVVLSVDAPADKPLCWHLSMGLCPLLPGQDPGRVPDALAKRLAAAFETPDEGPPEGAYRLVRHFRGVYTPN